MTAWDTNSREMWEYRLTGDQLSRCSTGEIGLSIVDAATV
jgi:hypothetical protein